MLAMDEFFDNFFYYNQRLRITTYSLILLISSALFVPYYIELDKFNQLHHQNSYQKQQLEDSEKIKVMDIDIYIESAFVIIWIGIGVSSLLMLLIFAICKEKSIKNKNIISWISSILLCAGSAILVVSYIVQNANNQRSIIKASINNEKFDIDDPIICYHFLVCAISWILAIDGISKNNYKYHKIQDNDKYKPTKGMKYDEISIISY